MLPAIGTIATQQVVLTKNNGGNIETDELLRNKSFGKERQIQNGRLFCLSEYPKDLTKALEPDDKPLMHNGASKNEIFISSQ
eukprot:CAMPEP_0202446400 /NCGR_PEP_ID=MMETSP1360-20130828/4891_1 /ASSEMBLY_ACC=CAM_ASM_000848 /TAXON_ID=515479 /ORGANISM="Licmophora paradoxa, Strain CCMP2313" /LENGTH=81 /DNA_ID=CAMNT_0049062861 /DNA_START=698 /DNA_END=940 /DNA_ORIENTATION=+